MEMHRAISERAGKLSVDLDVPLDTHTDTTALNVSFKSTCVTSGSAETDIVYQRGAHEPSRVLGRTVCNDAVSSTRCDQHDVRFDTGAPSGRNLACHETGHAVGLTHGQEADPAQANGANSLGRMQTPLTGDRFIGALLTCS